MFATDCCITVSDKVGYHLALGQGQLLVVTRREWRCRSEPPAIRALQAPE